MSAGVHPGSRVALAVTSVVVALAVASVVVTGYLAVARTGLWATHEVVTHLYFLPVQLAFGLVGAAVLARDPGHPVGGLLAAVGVAAGLGGVATPWVAMQLPGAGVVEGLAALVSATVLGLLALSLLLFPTGRPVAPGWRWVVRIVVLQMVVAALATLVDPVPGWARPLDTVGSFVIGILLLAVAVASLVVRWRRARGEERQQLTWLVLAGLVFGLEVLAGLVTTALDDTTTSPAGHYIGNAIFNLALLSIPVAMGLAITRYRLFDVDRIVSRTLAYGVLVVGVGALYAGAIAVVAGSVVGGSATATAAGLVVAALVAALVDPARSWLVHRSERWVYGARADRYGTMRALAADLARTATPDAVLTRVAQAATRATRARGARVVLAPDGLEAREASWGDAGGRPDQRQHSSVDLVVDGERVGHIVVLDPSGRGGDDRLLEGVVDLAAPALGNLVVVTRLTALDETLRTQNQDLVRARALLARADRDEREALRSVVDRRLRPRVEQLRQGLPTLPVPDPRVLRADYARLAERSRELAGEIRRLAHSVLPPLLVDRGLVPALRALAREAPVDVRLDPGDGVEDLRLPAEVETTVYLACRDTLETLSSEVVLGLAMSEGRVEFALTGCPGGADDTRVLAALGRVDALGGRSEVRDDGRVRRVRGTVPVPAPG